MENELLNENDNFTEDELDLMLSLYNIANPSFQIFYEIGDVESAPVEATGQIVITEGDKVFILPKFQLLMGEEKQKVISEIIDTAYSRINEISEIRIITPKLNPEDIDKIEDGIRKKAHWFFRTSIVCLMKYRESENEDLNNYMKKFYKEFYANKMNFSMNLKLVNSYSFP